MIFGRKKAPEKITKANERLVRKVLGKDFGRRVFGFLCAPDIPARMKILADKLHVPLFALSEHCVQLGAGQINKIAEEVEPSELLRRHILEVHVGKRTIEKISRYDEETANVLDLERLQRFEFEKAVSQIVMKYRRAGATPSEIDWAVDYGFRCRAALLSGQPLPTDMPPREYYRRSHQ
jgi:hypothetical protein